MFDILEWIDKIMIAITLVVTFKNFTLNKRNAKVQNMDITIRLILLNSNRSKDLPLTIKRKHFTRSEVQGVLGAVYKGKERYDIPSLAEKTFSNDLEDVQDGKKNILEIKIEDIDTFNNFSNE